MTEQLRVTPKTKVLEIGTGSGYQAAVLAEITPHVFTIEIHKALADTARARLQSLGYKTVRVKHGDGFHGWAEHAPFDAIIVTCAPARVPPKLVEQLAPGGRLILPVGGRYSVQKLTLVEKDAKGNVRTQADIDVRFVPLLRGSKK
jgi:protein-L-isoaspartate(D-aspartate) O-methyltransferase